MDARVLVLRDANGAAIRQMDVSDLANDDANAGMSITTETRCDLGEWHTIGRTAVSPWGQRISEPS